MHLLPLEGDTADEPSEKEDCESDEDSLGTKSRSCACARLRSLRAWSHPLGRAAEALELTASPTWRCGSEGTTPLPPVLCVVLEGIAKQSAFFCAYVSFPAASKGDFLLLSPNAPSPSPKTIISSGRQSHCAVRWLVTRRAGCCCSQWWCTS